MDGMKWRKSSYSSGSSGNCVEVASSGRRKASHSSSGNCAETASAVGMILLRDTTDRCGVTLGVPDTAWAKFLNALLLTSAIQRQVPLGPRRHALRGLLPSPDRLTPSHPRHSITSAWDSSAKRTSTKSPRLSAPPDTTTTCSSSSPGST